MRALKVPILLLYHTQNILVACAKIIPKYNTQKEKLAFCASRVLIPFFHPTQNETVSF